MQFGSCSGCTISFLDNGPWADRILDSIDLLHAPLITDRNEMPEKADLTIVEGAIAVTRQHLKKLHDLRERSKKMLSIGACAESSGILHYAVGNQMPQPELDAFLPAHEIVPVDYVMPGCPPAPAAIAKFLEAFISGDEDYLAPYAEIIGKPEGRIREIVQQGLCMSCGMCGATCPTHAISYVEGKPVIRDELCIMCGECYFQCPRSFFPCREGELTCDPGAARPMGVYAEGMQMRSSSPEIRKHAQAGGVVTALLNYCLDTKTIDGALVAKDGSNPWEGVPQMVERSEEVVASAGTKYAVCPTLYKLRESLTLGGLRKLAVVGLPCQMEALEKYMQYPLGIRAHPDTSILRIGLFCSSNFRYNAMHKMVEEVGGVRPADITRIDIGAGAFQITTVTGETIDIPLKVVHGYEQESCKVCPDFTSEFCDISVGAIGAREGWSAVLVRSERGTDIVKDATSEGYLEKGDEAPDMDLVKLLSEKKRMRANKSLSWREKYGLLNPFPGIDALKD